jgi:hypothetical protein
MRKLVVLASLLAALTAHADLLDGCDHQAPRNVGRAAAGVTKVVIVARAGELRIAGRAGFGEIRATGTACASSKALLDKIQLKLTTSGSVARIEAIVPDDGGWLSSSSLSMVVTLPAGMPIDVDDTSGGTEIRDVGAAVVHDTSGSLEIRNVRGNLDVTDTSGSMTIDDVSGNVRISDTSGSIDVTNIGGSVVITSDTSGSATIRKVRGDVNVISKGSGSLTVSDVNGSFSVGHKGSGKIEYERVAGRVSLPKKD